MYALLIINPENWGFRSLRAMGILVQANYLKAIKSAEDGK
jgi:hypothetical protein